MKNLPLALALSISSALFIPQANADVATGAYVNENAWNITNIDQLNLDVSRSAATINIFSSFNSDWSKLGYQANNVVIRNATPLITWMPYTGNENDSAILTEISQGARDTYIDNWIQGFKDWRNSYPEGEKPTILLRFAHEFNGTWYPWGNQPQQLKAAWVYLHKRFEDAGLSDVVSWVWCASATDVDDYNDVTQYYPGDDRVDWLSLDGYNWGSNYSFSSWRSFDEVFSHQYITLVSAYPGKPVMIAEVSSAEAHDQPDPAWGQKGDDSDAGESKELWVEDMMQTIETNYPAIKAIVWFNTNKELDWALNLSGNTGLSAYNTAVATQYFSDQLALITNPPETVTLAQTNARNRYALRDAPKLTGLAKALSVSRMPEAVGQKLLEREAKGIRAMPQKDLTKWRIERVLSE